MKNQKIKQATGLDLQDKEEEINELKKDATDLLAKDIEGREKGAQTDYFSAGQDVEGTVASFQILRKMMSQSFGMDIEKDQRLVEGKRGKSLGDYVKGGVTAEFIESDEGQRLIVEMAKMGYLEDGGTKFGGSKTGDDSFYAAAEKINAFLLKGLKAQDQIDLLNKKQKDIIDAVDLKVKGIEDELTEAAYAETALKYDIDPEELKNLKEYRYGGKVTETGLAMVHGSDRHPEIMFDNIQVDRMERLLTNAERNAGGRGNDFSTQNMNTIYTNNTKTVIAAPLRHLFGEHEARMVSANFGFRG